MRVIKYHLRTWVNRSSAETPDWQEVLTAVELDWCEANEQIARQEAADGSYYIEEVREEERA